jgi:hypothetical protein
MVFKNNKKYKYNIMNENKVYKLNTPYFHYSGRFIEYNNIKYRLHFKFTLSEDDIHITIPFPDGYPNTKYKRNRIDDFNYYKGVSDETEPSGFGKLEMNVEGTNDLFLLGFYINTTFKNLRNLATIEEKKATKGLGKEMLCFACKIMVDEGYINLNLPCKISLEAGGGECTGEEIDRDEKESLIKKIELDMLLSDIQRDYKNSYEWFMSTLNEKERNEVYRDIIEFYCNAKENLKLIKYYEQYGLRVTDDSDPLGVVMEGNLEDVFINCTS